jgi:hypothetical protein
MALRANGHGALAWRDVEDLVTLCKQLSVSGRELLEDEFKRVFKEHDCSVGWLRERRKAIADLSDDFLRLAESIKASAVGAWQAAGSPSGSDFVARLDDAIQSVAQAKQNMLERWPVGSDEEISEGRAAAQRGEGVDVDVAFAQIAGVDVASWRQRMEEA